MTATSFMNKMDDDYCVESGSPQTPEQRHHEDSTPEHPIDFSTLEYGTPPLPQGQPSLSDLPQLAWAHSTEASNDFRSDFCTKPTLPMLEAIIHTSLGDGDNDEDTSTNDFQAFLASLLGHEAALLVPSGTMGNQASLRAALGAPPHSILADHRGHIINWEGGGASSVSSAQIRMVVPSNGHHLTLADVRAHAVLGTSMYECPTRVISLENTLWGTVMPLRDMREIAAWARAQDPSIHVHLDGARAWEAAVAEARAAGLTGAGDDVAGMLREIAGCADSVQLCFTKGLGAPLGSVVAGSGAFIHRVRWARKMLGGGLRSSGVLAAPARVAVEDVFLGGKLSAAHEMARSAAAVWVGLGGKLAAPTETNMMWPDLKASGIDREKFNELAPGWDVKVDGPTPERLVFHYQITLKAFKHLCEFFGAIFHLGRTVSRGNDVDDSF